MNIPFYTFSKFFNVLTLILLIFGNSLIAHPPSDKPFLDDGKRYMALLLLNEGQADENGVPIDYRANIQAAHDKGFNAVYITVPWQMVKCFNRSCRTGLLPGPTSMAPGWNSSNRYWTTVDQEIAKAKELGMKIALRVSLTSQDVGKGVSKYLWGSNNNASRRPSDPGPQGVDDLEYYDSRQFSFSRQAAIDSAKLFLGEVLSRYGYLEGESNLLFIAVSASPTQEMEYDGHLLDYSSAALSEYNSWYQTKYGTNYPSVPEEFTSAEGKKWYAFRHKKLKDFVAQMSTQIKSYNSNIKFVGDYGSVFDGQSAKRGTLGFKSLGLSNTDGIKVNDDYSYDHRFSMDILRTNFPGKFIMNELIVFGNYPSNVYYDFINQSFAHGAKLFSVVADIASLNTYNSVFTQISSQWLTGTISPVASSGSVSYTFAEVIAGNYNGNQISTSSRNIYQEWLNTYNSNPGNAKPVNVYFNDNELNDNCTPPAAPSLTASPSTITAGAGTNVTLSSSACTGGTITWSDGLETGTPKTVSPAATKTYTATCSIGGCISSNGSVTVTVNPATCDFNMTATSSNANPAANASITLTATCAGANCSGLTYAWSGNGITGTASTKTFNAPATAGVYTYMVTASKSGCPNKTANVSVTVPNSGGGTINCVSMGDDCSGNSSEIRTYVLSSTAGSKALKLTYKAHEGASIGRIRINGGSWTNINLGQTGTTQYVETAIGSFTLVNGSNTIDVASNTNYICFRQLCAEGAGGCTSPVAPTLQANPASITSGSTTLTASGCSGTVTWSDALGTGISKTVSPTATKTYTATCSIGTCTSTNGSVTVTVVPPGEGGTTTCVSLGDQCSGNSSEIRSYTISTTAGSKTLRLNYRAHEGASVGRIRINGGSWTNFNLAQTGVTEYIETAIGSFTLINGNNSVEFASNTNYICFRQLCAVTPGCTTPSAPGLSANPSSINAGGSGTTLSATGCAGGTITWSDGLGTGTTKAVNPAATKTYTANCSIGGCTSANGSTTVTVIPAAGSGCVINKVRLQFRSTGDCCMDRLVGAKIQGSNNGSTWTDLYTISVNGTGSFQEFSFSNTTSYSSVRFVASTNGYGELQELEFYNGSTKRTGTSFGTSNYANVFDGSTTTDLWHASGESAPFFAGLNLSGCGSPSVLGTDPAELNTLKGIFVAPNPSKGVFETSFYLEKGKKAILNIIDLQGRTIYKKLIIGHGNHREKIILTNKASGTMFLQLHSNKGIEVNKINIVR